jgi:hypothetical protein
MAHDFDIRFARSSGLAAFLEAPENSFRWKGNGTLRIDAQGVSIKVKRGLLTLLGGNRTRRIDAADFTDIYRERDALRLEFNTPGDRHAAMRFWARDRNAAAEIVRLLPTRRTVEIDETLAGEPNRFRIDGRFVAVTLATLVLAAIGMGALARFYAMPTLEPEISTPVEEPARTVPMEDGGALPVGIPTSPQPAPGALKLPFPVPTEPVNTIPDVVAEVINEPRMVAPRDQPEIRILRVPMTDGIVPIVPGEVAYDAARAQLDFFLRASNDLQGQYLYGRTTQSDLESQWWELTQSIYNSSEFDDPSLRALIDAELAASQNWRNALWLYQEASAARSSRDLATARELIERADRLTDRVKFYVY